jgi:hypothetical protein
MMGWYGAQVILYIRFMDGNQTETPVWENTYLIEASDSDTAFRLAKERGKLEEGDRTWGGRPAEWVFAGVRSVSEVFHESPVNELGHGDEVLFEEFIVHGLSAVEALVKGDECVKAEFTELPDPPSARGAGDGEEGANL